MERPFPRRAAEQLKHRAVLQYVPYAPYVVLLAALFVFPSLFFITAPYGRFTREGWGLQIGSSMGWLLMEGVSFVVFALFWWLNPQFGTPVVSILGVAWLVHYGQRSFIYPLLMKSPGKPKPASIAAMAILFNTLNASGNAYTLVDRPIDAPLVIGLLIFAAGFVGNVHSDHVLRTLRAPGETGYKVPQAGLHRLVAAPNYFAELIEWLGFAIAAQTLASWAFVVFTFANLAPRAVSNLKWYREKFPEYPKGRKALIPFVW